MVASRELRIIYHATNKQNAQKILKRGFKPKTYFAQHLEDALGYGGNYLFEVIAPREFAEAGWQIINKKIILPDQIISLVRIDMPEVLYDKPQLRIKVEESNMTPGELEYIKSYETKRPRNLQKYRAWPHLRR